MNRAKMAQRMVITQGLRPSLRVRVQRTIKPINAKRVNAIMSMVAARELVSRTPIPSTTLAKANTGAGLERSIRRSARAKCQ